jgi:hypothetical protein
VQVAAADAVIKDAQFHVAGPGFRLRDRFEPQILPPMKDGRTHYKTAARITRPPRALARLTHRA